MSDLRKKLGNIYMGEVHAIPIYMASTDIDRVIDVLLESLPNPKGLLQYVDKGPSREATIDVGYNRAIEDVTQLLNEARKG